MLPEYPPIYRPRYPSSLRSYLPGKSVSIRSSISDASDSCGQASHATPAPLLDYGGGLLRRSANGIAEEVLQMAAYGVTSYAF